MKLLNKSINRNLLYFIILLTPLPAIAAESACFIEAGNYFKIDPLLLRSIAEVESNMNPAAIGKNFDSEGNVVSRDLGLMQVNQIHVPALKQQGIISSETDLINDPCLNIKVGSWILYKHFSRCGVNWTCLGTYNAGFASRNVKKRNEYAGRVYKVYQKNASLMIKRPHEVKK